MEKLIVEEMYQEIKQIMNKENDIFTVDEYKEFIEVYSKACNYKRNNIL